MPDPDRQLTIFEWAGGLPALTRMTRLFYEKHVPADPLLAPLFARMSPDHPQRVAAWLGEVFGGPKAYSEQYGGYPRMVSQHLGKQLTEDKRARWVTLLRAAARDAGLPNDPEFASAFGSYIEWGSRLAVENSQAGAKPPEHMPMPHWDWRTAAGITHLRAHPARRRPKPEPVPPDPGETPRFEQHIKPLFRRRDRQSMSFAFDLWSHGDVSQHATAILGRRFWPARCPATAPGRRRKPASSPAGSTPANPPERRHRRRPPVTELQKIPHASVTGPCGRPALVMHKDLHA